MNADYHYPPELISLLVDTIPRLCRSKRDVILFFRGAGAAENMLAPFSAQLACDRRSLTKYEIARELIVNLNELGDSGIRVRRELIKRVVQFESYGQCFPHDQLAAQGLVSQIRSVVHAKDSFTRMEHERDEEKRRRVFEQQAKIDELQKRRAEREEIKRDLYALFPMTNAHARGKALESVLNRLFDAFGISIHDAFTITDPDGTGIVEQVDGAIELDGVVYLVEMKWLSASVGSGDVAPHLVRVFNRGTQVRGLFISYSEYSNAAVSSCRDLIANGGLVVLATIQEVVTLLERDGSLRDWLRSKVNAALTEKQPFVRMSA